MAYEGDIRACISHAAPRRARAPLPRFVDRPSRLTYFMLEPGNETRSPLGAVEQHIEGPRHLLALQESSESMDAHVINKEFHFAHFRRWPTLFNKNTLEPDLVPGYSKYCRGFTMMSVHCHNEVAMCRSIARDFLSTVLTTERQGCRSRCRGYQWHRMATKSW